MKVHAEHCQAGEARTAIGAGLLHFGVDPGSTVGLYSINCRGGLLAVVRPRPMRAHMPQSASAACLAVHRRMKPRQALWGNVMLLSVCVAHEHQAPSQQ